jgi:hypothetical protein
VSKNEVLHHAFFFIASHLFILNKESIPPFLKLAKGDGGGNEVLNHSS